MKLTPRHTPYSLAAIFALAVLASAPAVAEKRSANPKADPQLDERDYADEDYDELRVLLSLGADYSRGDYGVKGPKTRSGSAVAAAKIELEPLTLRVSVPYLISKGCPLPEDQCTDDLKKTTGTDKGLGDVVTSLTYTWYPDSKNLPLIDFTTKVKIPTATDMDLGTGATDVTLQIELLQNIGPFYVFGGGGYRFKGGHGARHLKNSNLPSGPGNPTISAHFKNVIVASAGGGLRVSKSVSVGAAYDFRESSTRKGTDSHEISPSVTLKLGEHIRLAPYGVIGLSDGAPNWGVGSTVSYQF